MTSRTIRTALRTAVAGGVVAAALLWPGTAQAATSSSAVVHADGKIAGHVWYNAGTHNMAKGRNSFTVKDSMCGDGWVVAVTWVVFDETGKARREGELSVADCTESSFSALPYAPRTSWDIGYVASKISVTSGAEEEEEFVFDLIG